jgi:hypothetical protein
MVSVMAAPRATAPILHRPPPPHQPETAAPLGIFLPIGLPHVARASTSSADARREARGKTMRQETDLTFKTRLAALLSATALALATPLAAQQVPPPQIAAKDVTDAQVAAFVTAILAVEEVRNDYGPRIDGADDEAAQQALAKEANDAAAAAVAEVENIDVKSYVAIANAASENEALNRRIVTRIAELREQ